MYEYDYDRHSLMRVGMLSPGVEFQLLSMMLVICKPYTHSIAYNLFYFVQ